MVLLDRFSHVDLENLSVEVVLASVLDIQEVKMHLILIFLTILRCISLGIYFVLVVERIVNLQLP